MIPFKVAIAPVRFTFSKSFYTQSGAFFNHHLPALWVKGCIGSGCSRTLQLMDDGNSDDQKFVLAFHLQCKVDELRVAWARTLENVPQLFTTQQRLLGWDVYLPQVVTFGAPLPKLRLVEHQNGTVIQFGRPSPKGKKPPHA